MTEANKRQVGGNHYKAMGIEHWDVVALNNLDYFQGQVTKYVMRWRGKNGLQDLEKAHHFLQKYIEVEKLRAEGKLTHAILMSIIAKLEQEEHRQALANERDEDVVVTASKTGVIVTVSAEPSARACPQCLNVLPAHAIGCPLATRPGAECELCGGLERHLPTCPQQR